MKTWKQGIVGILAIIVLAFAFIACDDDNDNEDSEVPDSITANGKEIILAGITLTQQQKDKIIQAFGFANIDNPSKTNEVLNRGITIIIESNAGYDYYKVYANNKLGLTTVFIDSDGSVGDLRTIILGALYNGSGQVKAIPPVHDKGWQLYKRQFYS